MSPPTMRSITWQHAITEATRALERAGIRDAQLNAELLAAHVIGAWTRGEARASARQPVTEKESEQYRSALARRMQHEPLQYITGETEFFGLRLYTTPAALIPRPDTEILVEHALKEALRFGRHVRMLDIGTGSGCIALALASKLPEAKIAGVDISEDAIRLAQRNRERLGFANAVFRRSDIFSESDVFMLGAFDVIVSNPPYVSLAEYETLDAEVRLHEPRQALTDEGGGLRFYERIFQLKPQLLDSGGSILVEIGYGERERVMELAARYGHAEVFEDLSGVSRVLSLR